MAFIGNTVQTQGFTPAIDYFSGNGSAVTFTLSRPVASVAQVIVAIDNVIQNSSTAYSVTGNAITFTSAPLSGSNNIWVQYTSLITTYAAISQDPSVIGDITASGGFLSTGDFGNTYTDGTIVDYVTGNARITTGPADGLTIYNGGTASRTALMTLDSSGNMGVGTTSPNEKLGVAGAIASTSNAANFNQAKFTLDYNVGTGRLSSYASGGSGIEFYTNASGGTVFPRMLINGSGNVGIGTSSPGTDAKLDVIGTITIDSAFTSTDFGLCFRRGFETNDNCRIYAGDTGQNRKGGIRISAFDGFAVGAGSNTWAEKFRIANNGAITSVIPGGSTLYPNFACRAWVSYNGTASSIRGSGNVSSVTRNSTANYTINFSSAMADTNYCWVAGSGMDNIAQQTWISSPNSTSVSTWKTTTTLNLIAVYGNSLLNTDSADFNVAILR